MCAFLFTIDNTITQGKSRLLTMAIDSDVLPEPELPAMAMMLVLVHGGE